MPRFLERLRLLVPQLPLLISMSMNAALLYATLPLLDVSFDEARLKDKLQLISESTDADVYNLWQVHVASNDRHYIASIVRDEADRPVVDEFGRSATAQPFSKVITAAGVTAMLGGNSMCEGVEDVIAPLPLTQTLRQKINAKHVCFIPVRNARNEMIGYVALIWKQDRTADDLLAQVTIVRGILQKSTSPWD